jgi:plasmid stability protein
METKHGRSVEILRRKKLTCVITGENSSLPDDQMQDGVSLIGFSHEIIQ